MNALGIVAFVVALLLSVMIHEAGHFLTARAFGMKATQFFVGFGPTLFSRQRGETEYGVKAIPAGGFVKIIGMTPLEQVDPADSPRAFYRQPTPQRVVVLGAGSAMHFVIAIVLAIGVAFFVPQADPGALVAQVSTCVPRTVTAQARPTSGSCSGNELPSPALAAGLRAGDAITGFDGRTLTSDDDLGKLIRTSPGAAATLTVRRGSQTLRLPVQLAAVQRNRSGGGAGSDPAFALGVAFGDRPPGYSGPSLGQARHQVAQYLGWNNQSVLFGTFYAVKGIGHSAGQLFNSNRANDSGAQLSSVYGIAAVSGDVIAAKGVPVSVRVGDFLLIVAAVNASVGILNLLPLLPFDGGHIAVTLAERWTRRRRTIDVGRRIAAFYTRGAPVMYAFSLVIVVFSVLVLIADVKNPVA